MTWETVQEPAALSLSSLRLLRVPTSLLPLYRIYCIGEVRELIHRWWFLFCLVIASLNLMAFGTLTHPFGTAYQPVLMSALSTTVLNMGALAFSFRPVAQVHWNRWVPAVFAITVFLQISCNLAVDAADPGHLVFAIQITVITCLIGLYVLQLRVRATVLAAIGGGMAFMPTAVSTASNAYWAFLVSYASVCTILVICSAVRDERRRVTFMLAVTLSQQNARMKQINRVLEVQALRDPLTLLRNRRAFEEQLHQEWVRAMRQATPLSVLMIDIDHFKQYNDHAGHPAGDRCLLTVATALSETIRRPGDCVARYGGEEFVALLPNTDAEGALHVAQQCLQKIDDLALPHPGLEQGARVSLSIGCASTWPEFHRDRQALVKWADEALYVAKNNGRHQVAQAPSRTSRPKQLTASAPAACPGRLGDPGTDLAR
ncbi:GGDEF domain-containing protein [Aquabacterium lacunae]|uniref:diguanylate cyclase n=1 Tax=Aquabacterium lacunae TaxID=2528630 RepID=A0A4Q9GY63_9BURK|nr:diguanylate cyclase [Aquabacterium lacunae]TBO31165.1 GGDEF domain-containing protein [Aquabacterium lacunae]